VVNTPDNIAPGLRAWLDDSEQRGIPVVYLALGSTGFFNERQQAAFLRAFVSCPAQPLPAESGMANNTTATVSASSDNSHFRVVWQANRPLAAPTRAAMPEWVREEKWVAQPAVLSHPATSLFISHAGSQSIQESLAAGLPLLSVPFFGDQYTNAARLKDKGCSLTVNYKRVGAEELCEAMRHLVYDKQVRANVDRLQQIYHLTTDGASRGADIVERAAYVGTKHLIPYRERTDVSWVIRYNVDVYAIGVGIVALLAYGLFRMLAALVGAGLAIVGGRPKSKLA
jgi:hypothetical protein